GQSRRRPEAPPGDGQGPRHRRCPPPADHRRAGPAPERGPDPDVRAGTDPAGRGRQRAGSAQLDRAGVAQLLGQPGKPGQLPRGSSIVIRGQVESMNSSFTGLAAGLGFAVLLVYLLMVVNFQSWLDPFIILTALPGAVAGILWMLYATGTTVSVPALMGAIMCIGVATSNSILMVTFANDQRRDGHDARSAAL